MLVERFRLVQSVRFVDRNGLRGVDFRQARFRGVGGRTVKFDGVDERAGFGIGVHDSELETANTPVLDVVGEAQPHLGNAFAEAPAGDQVAGVACAGAGVALQTLTAWSVETVKEVVCSVRLENEPVIVVVAVDGTLQNLGAGFTCLQVLAMGAGSYLQGDDGRPRTCMR